MKKNMHNILLAAAAGLMLLASCKKDLSEVTFNGGTAPALTATASDSIPLPLSDTTATAVTFNWTNPDYQYSDGISSMNVNYYLQFDTTANFNSANLQTVGLSNGLSATYTVAQFNAIVSNSMGLSTGQPHTVDVRVQSFIPTYTAGAQPVGQMNSNTLSFHVTPYALPPAVPPPSSDTLYITGSATSDGWMSGGNPASVSGQGLKRIKPTLWTITLPLIGGQQFLLVPVAGDWSNKYATSNANSSPTGGTFQYNSANNFNGPAASGTYTVTFNFQSGQYTITQ